MKCDCGDCGYCKVTQGQSKEQVDILPDMAAALSQLGRGSLTARIAMLEAALRIAEQALESVDLHGDSGGAAKALEQIRHLQAKGRAF